MSVPLQPCPPSPRVYRQRVCGCVCVCVWVTASASSTTAMHPRLRLPSRILSHGARSAVIPLQCLGLGLGNPLAHAGYIDCSRLQSSCRPRSWTSSQPCLQPAKFQRTKESLGSSQEGGGTRRQNSSNRTPGKQGGGHRRNEAKRPSPLGQHGAREHGVVASWHRGQLGTNTTPLLAADRRCKCLSMPPIPVSGSGPKEGAGMGFASPAPSSLDLLKNLPARFWNQAMAAFVRVSRGG